MIDKIVGLAKDPRVALSILVSLGLVVWLNPLPNYAIAIIFLAMFCWIFLVAAIIMGIVRLFMPKNAKASDGA